ncbi:hypothetical protein ABFS83_13G136300 [Erythranthe nasuta]
MVCWCYYTGPGFRLVLCETWKTLLLRRRFALQHRAKPFLHPAVHLIVQPITLTNSLQMETAVESLQNDESTTAAAAAATEHTMSKNAQKRLLKQQRYEAKKAEKKAQMKEHKKKEAERKRKEWDEKLANLSEEEKEKLIQGRKEMRKERMEQRNVEKGMKMERLNEARISGQNIVIDLEFAHLMSPSELHSLVQQVMYCYAINGRCDLPAHLWLTGCQGEMHSQLLRIPGYDKWVMEKEDGSYIEAFQDQKEKLVYLTADSENVLDELDPKAIYIIGGLVDRNRWKGITMKKAEEQGIKTAKLPIGTYLKMSSSQVLTVNQVVEILLKYLETRDWKDAFFQVIPQRKRCEAEGNDKEDEKKGGISEEDDEQMCGVQEEADSEDGQNVAAGVKVEDCVEIDGQKTKRQCTETTQI